MAASDLVLDRHRRPLRNLRVSVTDRCNLRCAYCMPEREYEWLPRDDLLHHEEVARLVEAFEALGVRKVRLTGGEPLLRRDLPVLVRLLASRPALEDLAMTTNGLLLGDFAAELRTAGLQRLSISLDTLDRERFRELTRRDELGRVLAGLDAAERVGFRGTKLNAVIVRGTNDDEISTLLSFGRERGIEVRFIEYMDVAGATRWRSDAVVPRDEILARISESHGPVEADANGDPNAPAERFRLTDGTPFGIIASTSAPFCGACDRARLTADGQWLLCLYARKGLDLRGPLRAGESLEALRERVASVWRAREDRGAEERLATGQREALAPAAMGGDPHLEMHTRGG